MNTKKLTAILLTLVLTLGLFSGCGDDSQPGSDDKDNAPEYTVITPADTSAMSLSTADDGTIEFSYPSDSWTAYPEISPFTIYYNETITTDQAVNINIQSAGEYGLEITEEDLNNLEQSITSGNPFLKMSLSELRTLNGEIVMYMEYAMEYTDELIDMALDNGIITEEFLESAGGRQAFLERPPVKQIAVYAVAGGHLTALVGSYFDDAQKAEVIDTMTVMIGSVKAL